MKYGIIVKECHQSEPQWAVVCEITEECLEPVLSTASAIRVFRGPPPERYALQMCRNDNREREVVASVWNLQDAFSPPDYLFSSVRQFCLSIR